MKPWEIKEAELLKRENAYLENLNWFEKIVHNHLYYCIFLVAVWLVSWSVGLIIGVIIA